MTVRISRVTLMLSVMANALTVTDSQGHLMKLLDLLQIRVQPCPAHSNVPGIELRVLVQKRQLGW